MPTTHRRSCDLGTVMGCDPYETKDTMLDVHPFPSEPSWRSTL